MFGEDVFITPKMSHQEKQNYLTSHQGGSIFDCVDFNTNTQHPSLHLDNPEDHDSGPSFPDVDFFRNHLKDEDEETPQHSMSDSLLRVQPEVETSNGQVSLPGTDKKSNNTTENILKHSLKKTLDKEWKPFISCCCQFVEITYDRFVGYWGSKIQKILPKFFGINRFLKMVKTKQPQIEVFTYFLAVYLQKDYMTYLITSSIKKKQVYMEEAIRIIYITQVSQKRAQEMYQLAQKGLQI